MIRAIPSNASDNVYCTLLAQSVVHGAMAGYTGYTSGLVNGRQTYIPFYVSSLFVLCLLFLPNFTDAYVIYINFVNICCKIRLLNEELNISTDKVYGKKIRLIGNLVETYWLHFHLIILILL